MHFQIISPAVSLGQINGGPFSTGPIILFSDQITNFSEAALAVEAKNPGCRDEVIPLLWLDYSQVLGALPFRGSRKTGYNHV